MIVKLNDEQMLALWREGAGLEPAFSEASIERFDAVNVNAILRRAMRAWYVDYLHTAPIDMVPVTDLTEKARVSAAAAPHQWVVTLMCDCARLTSLELDRRGFIPIVDPKDPANYGLIRRLANRFVRRGCQNVALHVPGTNRMVLNVHSKSEPVVSAVYGVEVSPDDTFYVDERILARIPSQAIKTLAFET